MKTVLQEVTQPDIPSELSERLAEEKRIETVSYHQKTTRPANPPPIPTG